MPVNLPLSYACPDISMKKIRHGQTYACKFCATVHSKKYVLTKIYSSSVREEDFEEAMQKQSYSNNYSCNIKCKEFQFLKENKTTDMTTMELIQLYLTKQATTSNQATIRNYIIQANNLE